MSEDSGLYEEGCVDGRESGLYEEGCVDGRESGLYEEGCVDGREEEVRGGENLQALLDQKHNDLMLAAELGKALLEKNAELERKVEQSTDEYGHQIEVLQQEKYAQHLKFENLEAEYENTVKELQYDIGQLKDELASLHQHAHNGEKESNTKIRELSLQNEKLLEELQQSKVTEERLSDEIDELRDTRGLTDVSTCQATQIECLHDQITKLSERIAGLERSLQKLSEEKESYINLLDETQDRVKILEKMKNEHETELEKTREEMRELRDRNTELHGELEHLTEKSNSSGQSITLFNELTQSSGTTKVAMAIDSPINPYPPSMFGDDDIECDDDDVIMTMDSPIRFEETQFIEEGNEQSKLEEDIVHAYRYLREMCLEIKSQMGDKLEDDDQSVISDTSGSLNGVIVELRDVIHGALDKANQTQSSHLSEITSLQQRVGDLDHNLKCCQGDLSKLREQLQLRDQQLQQKSYKMSELAKQTSGQQEDIRVLSSQRDKLQDMLTHDSKKPQMFSAMTLLKHARRERDAAIERRYTMEKELQQARYEAIVLNHQLIEAVQQKNSLSVLMDQWQSDMANLLGVHVTLPSKGPGVDTVTKPKETDKAQ